MEIDEFRKKWTDAQEKGLYAAMVTFPVGAERESGEKVKEKVCDSAGLRGSTSQHVFYTSDSVVKIRHEDGKLKPSRRILMYFQVEEKYEKVIALKTVRLNGHDFLIDVDSISEPKEVKLLKRITVLGVPLVLVEALIERLKLYAEFSGKILMSEKGILSVPVDTFKYAVPQVISFSKNGMSFELAVRIQGYTTADSVKLKPLPQTSSVTSDPKTPATPGVKWGSATVRRRPDRVKICHYCHVPGHVKEDCEERKKALEKVKCHNCQQNGHFRWNCKNEAACRICKETGHLAKDCPNRNRRRSRFETKSRVEERKTIDLINLIDEEKSTSLPRADVNQEVVAIEDTLPLELGQAMGEMAGLEERISRLRNGDEGVEEAGDEFRETSSIVGENSDGDLESLLNVVQDTQPAEEKDDDGGSEGTGGTITSSADASAESVVPAAEWSKMVEKESGALKQLENKKRKKDHSKGEGESSKKLMRGDKTSKNSVRGVSRGLTQNRMHIHLTRQIKC